MKLSIQYLKLLEIPPSAWSLKLINGRTFYRLIDPVYCKVFWIHFYKHIVLPSFEKQNYYTTIGTPNLTAQVYIDEFYNLVLPFTIESMIDYSSKKFYSTTIPKFTSGLNLNLILIIYLIGVLVFIFIGKLLDSVVDNTFI